MTTPKDEDPKKVLNEESNIEDRDNTATSSTRSTDGFYQERIETDASQALRSAGSTADNNK